MRLDQLLVQRRLAPSRSAALRLVERGAVRWRANAAAIWSIASKAGIDLAPTAEIEITDDAETRWVSRGGLKLDSALARCGLDITARTVLDVGQSTGGFTEVLLARGAARVVGIDVGHGQLHPRLAADARVLALEGRNARHLCAGDLPEARYDLVVGDLSFISLSLVLPALAPWIAADLLMLVKPQFELQPADIGKGGLVTDPLAHARVETRIRSSLDAIGLTVRDYFPSAITGGDGNTEFFVWAQP
jgi:23S rRNA (cytidine1920-2'-O)/16S rRNA (cytidine1409-2'-O)-methyltransferase